MKTSKLILWDALGVVIIAIMALFFVFYCASSTTIVYESDSFAPWVVVDKHTSASFPYFFNGGIINYGPGSHSITILHSGDPSCTTTVSVDRLSMEEWNAINPGDVCYYPEESINFWDYYVLGKRPGPEDGFQISGTYAEKLQWQHPMK